MNLPMPLVLKMALLAVAVAAGVYDLRTRKIPNWLNLSGVILGLGLNTLLLHGHGLLLAMLGLGLSLLVYLPLYAVRGMGAGDVKLMAAIGSMAGPQNWLGIFLVTAILGGIASVVLVLRRRRVHETLSNLATITGELAHARMPFERDAGLDMHSKQALGLPHGAVIAAGSLAFLCLSAVA
jgi:prepilin peptidase CpaA